MNLSKPKLYAFAVSLVGAFLMAALPHLGIKTPSLINPMPNGIDKFESIRPNLEQTKNDFKVKEEHSIIEPVQASEIDSEVKAYSAIDFETGDVLLEKDLNKKLPIASLTKIMTAVVALDLASSQELLTVSEDSTKAIPSKVFLKTGEKLTVEELLNCFLLSSANDCAGATKDGIDQKYGSPVFIKAMNAKAQFIGLKNSHFENPQGFDSENHYSTVEDLTILSHYALKNYPLIAQIVSKESETLPQTDTHRRYFLNNWNGLLGVYPGVTGIKIGNTDDAGNTTVVLSKRKDGQGVERSVLVVVLGAQGILQRDMEASAILDLAFQKTWGIEPVDLKEADFRAKYATWKY